MRIFPIFLLGLAACRTVGHTVDDLAAVHSEAEFLSHRYQVERFGWIGGWLHFGPIGEMLGPWRYGKKAKDELEDPAEFCAERIREFGSGKPQSIEFLVGGVYWTGKALIEDPYVLSRVFAAEALANVGEGWIPPESLESALQKDPPEYKERTKLRFEELLALFRLRTEGKAVAEDSEKYRRGIAELAATRFDRAMEGPAVAALLSKLHSEESGQEKAILEIACRHLLSRSIPQLLLAGLRDPSEFVREGSLVALHRIFGKKSIPESLRSLASETSPLVRRRLADLCGELSVEEAQTPREKNAMDFLFAATRDADGSVAAAAMASLSRITGQEARYDREFWKSWWESYLLRGKS